MSEGVIRAWRLSKARYAGDLSGQGEARDGQRWNQRRQRAVVLGLSPEITVPEVMVHLNGVLIAPQVLSCYEVAAAPGLISDPDPDSFATFGGDWLRDGQQLGLVLPSVVVPQARNLLLNPLHPAMA